MEATRDKFGRFVKGTKSIGTKFNKGEGYWLGKKRLSETNEKIRKTLTGFKHSEQARKNMSEAAKRNGVGKWMTGKHLSEETKKKLSIIGKKFRHSEESKRKITNSKLGKKHSIETRKKLSLSARKGEKSNFWNGGSSKILYTNDWTSLLRDTIRERDAFVCQECGIHQEELVGRSKKLDVHHIDYNKDNCNENNLITLCRACHIKTNFNREYWIEYFKK